MLNWPWVRLRFHLWSIQNPSLASIPSWDVRCNGSLCDLSSASWPRALRGRRDAKPHRIDLAGSARVLVHHGGRSICCKFTRVTCQDKSNFLRLAGPNDHGQALSTSGGVRIRSFMCLLLWLQHHICTACWRRSTTTTEPWAWNARHPWVQSKNRIKSWDLVGLPRDAHAAHKIKWIRVSNWSCTSSRWPRSALLNYNTRLPSAATQPRVQP